MSKNVNELKNLRKSLGFTQIQAAKAIGVSRRKYQTYELAYDNEEYEKTYNELVEKINFFLDPANKLLTIKQIKDGVKNVFDANGKVECAYLFGSYARGDATIESDIDILVIAPELVGFAFVSLISSLNEELHKDIDLLTLSSISGNIEMLTEILTKGVKIYG